MTITEEIKSEILEAVRKGKPIAPICEKYKRSKGPLYNALGKAFAVVVDWVEDARSKLNETISEESKVNASLQATIGMKKKAEKETKDAERRCAELHETERKYEGNIKETLKRLGGLEQDYEEKKCKKEADLQSALKPLKLELEKTKSEIAALNEEAGRRGLSPQEALNSLRKLGDLRQEFERLCAMIEGKKKELDWIISKRKREDDNTTSRRKKASRAWDATIAEKEKRRNELDQQIEKKKGQERLLTEEFKHGVGAEFFKILRDLDSGDRLTILGYGLVTCTYGEAETLFQTDLNRRLRGEILKTQQKLIRDLMRELR